MGSCVGSSLMRNRNPPRYMSEAEQQLTGVAFRLPPDTAKKIDRAAKAAGIPKRQFVAQAIDQLADAILAAAEATSRTADHRRKPSRPDQTPAEYRHRPYLANSDPP